MKAKDWMIDIESQDLIVRIFHEHLDIILTRSGI